jgi:hypothetical protein
MAQQRVARKPRATKTSWTDEEDQLLLTAIREHSTASWRVIAECVGTRKDWQCCERYQNQLRPGIKKEPFSAEEDDFILTSVDDLSLPWSFVAQLLDGRTATGVKNRYFLLRRRLLRSQKAACADETGTALCAHGAQPRPQGHIKAEMLLPFIPSATPALLRSDSRGMSNSSDESVPSGALNAFVVDIASPASPASPASSDQSSLARCDRVVLVQPVLPSLSFDPSMFACDAISENGRIVLAPAFECPQGEAVV